jgi:hypothetical protein
MDDGFLRAGHISLLETFIRQKIFCNARALRLFLISWENKQE